MRIDVKKFLFIGLHDAKEAFFKNAQEIGLVHFIDSHAVKSYEIPPDIEHISAAIKVLRGLPPVEQEETDEYAIATGLAQKILDLKHNHEKLEEEKRIVNLDIARVEIFGDFSLDDITYIEKEGNRKIQFFFAGKKAMDDRVLSDEMLYVGTEHNLDYFVAINPKPVQYDKMIEMRIERPLGMLLKRTKEIDHELHAVEQRIKTYAKYNQFLHHSLIHHLNKYDLNTAENYVQYAMDGTLFAVEGWVPVDKISVVNGLVENMDVHMEEVAIEPNDRVPTYLENKGASRLGEDLIRIYDIPSITDKDPSLWVLGFFALFFAFIVGDGGYGLIFLGIALYVRYKMMPNPGNTGKRVMNLIILLCGCIIVWGVLTNSFFGYTFNIDSPMRKISVLNWMVEKKVAYVIQHHDETYQEWVKNYPQLKGVTDPHEFITKAIKMNQDGNPTYEVVNKFADNIMLELALFIGVIHVGLSMLRYLNRNWSFIGWLMFLVGCYLYLPVYLGSTSLIHFVFGVDKAKGAQDGLYLIFGGIGIACVIAIFKHKLLGVFEVMTMIQIFADVLSYLRLYALGLAGAIMTGVINEMMASTIFVVGILVSIVGHIINMVLSIMGGVIHGLRLNFIEWYHYSFEGGGKDFKPLRKLTLK